MRSRWADIKTEAIALRKSGHSINDVEKKLGIARSTLSGWFKHVHMDDTRKARLQKNKEQAWAKARINAALWHAKQKQIRLDCAEAEALDVISRLDTRSNDLLNLAFAMLYLGEGAKNGGTSIASSDPKILQFSLIALERVYGLKRNEVKCDLHLRMDQNEQRLKLYWASELRIPLANFRRASYDSRSLGRTTYSHYKGVCVLSCGNVAIQRRLIALYNLFCEKVASLGA